VELLLWFLTAAVIAAASTLAVLKHFHIYQQNGYKAAAQLKWLRKRPFKDYVPLIAAFAILLAYLPDIFPPQVWILVFIPFCLIYRPVKNVKKPLRFTGRLIRMLVTSSVLYIAALLCPLLFGDKTSDLAPLLVYFALAPVIPLTANFINYPLEASFRGYYIRDAKKILKSHPDLTVIGITGSYGKTSVKYYLTALLSETFDTLMTPESFNTPMGVVKTIREQLRPTTEIFVCEMGARRKGEIKELCGIVSPTHGVITSIGEQHLETFKTQEAIIGTKFELADAVKDAGIIFLNGDNALIAANKPEQSSITYGCDAKNDVYADNIRVTPDGTSFSLSVKGERVEGLRTKLIGGHNVVNLTGAVAVAMHLGVSADAVRSRLRRINPAPHRLELLKRDGVTVIDDAYNSNPAGASAALDALSLFDAHKILVTPGMIELGERQDELNFDFGSKAASICDFVVLVGKTQTEAIFKGLTAAGFSRENIYVTDDFNDAAAKAYGMRFEAKADVKDARHASQSADARSARGAECVILFENDLPDNAAY
jgi:UDP-N-acetylmuramoyl-tripeptide--D-alanyl-D-alanine ligase